MVARTTRKRASAKSGRAHPFQGLLDRASGAVLALDDDMRVLAMNAEARRDLGPSGRSAIGLRCYELFQAADSDRRGRPCRESCGLANSQPQGAWVFTRMVHGILGERGTGDIGRPACHQCLVVRCRIPGAGSCNLWFIARPGEAQGRAGVRGLEAVQRLQPFLSGPAGIREVLSAAIDAIVGATDADLGRATLPDPDSGEPAIVVTRKSAGPGVPATAGPAAAMEPTSESGLAGMAVLSAEVGTAGSNESDLTWHMSAPLTTGGHVTARLSVTGHGSSFDISSVASVMSLLTSQLAVYLRWALPRGRTASGSHLTAEAAPVVRLAIRCLGPFQIAVDGESIPDDRFHRARAVSLLKYLVSRGRRPVPREVLVDVLWPESEPGRASANLRVVLHALRRALEPGLGKGETSSYVHSKGDLVYLDGSDRIWIDVEEFVTAARRAAGLASQGRSGEALVQYQRAVALYRGDYLEDEPYSDWCLFERERAREMYLSLLSDMASIQARDGELKAAIETCRRALGVDRGREEMHRLLIRLLWASGRKDEALRQYDICRRVLLDEIGARPTQETQALYQDMLRDRAPVARRL